jgi:proteasome lid subunit RPN8/RPN11
VTRFLALSAPLADTVREAARRAWPGECCGLIEGSATEGGWRASAIHETRNIAPEPARHFLVDVEAQLQLARSLRGTGRDVIGCYHSHPNGRAEPSERDRDGAVDDGFVWLIAGLRESETPLLAAFVFDAKGKRFERLALTQTG